MPTATHRGFPWSILITALWAAAHRALRFRLSKIEKTSNSKLSLVNFPFDFQAVFINRFVCNSSFTWYKKVGNSQKLNSRGGSCLKNCPFLMKHNKTSISIGSTFWRWTAKNIEPRLPETVSKRLLQEKICPFMFKNLKAKVPSYYQSHVSTKNVRFTKREERERSLTLNSQNG